MPGIGSPWTVKVPDDAEPGDIVVVDEDGEFSTAPPEGESLPDFTETEDGDVLTIAEGEPTWAPPSGGGEPVVIPWTYVGATGGGTAGGYYCRVGDVMYLAINEVGWSGSACTFATDVTGYEATFPVYGADGQNMYPGPDASSPQLASNGVITLPAAGPAGTYATGIFPIPLIPAEEE